jgi:signal transduction histidine kinase
MSHRKQPVHRQTIRMEEAEALVHVLKTHQVDGIVGEHHVMVCRLKEVEEKLENSRDQVRALAANLQSVRESERAVIAREIHDEFGQTLTGLELGLSWLARKATRRQQLWQKKIGSLSALVTTMIQSVRRIANELRPGVLDELGLVKTLQSEAREFQGHTGIRCGFETNIGKASKFDRAGSIALFRIAQAALTNAARHARASRATIVLRKSKHNLTLTVNDNGKGITKKLVHSHNSLGIIGMRERAIALDGTLTLQGSRGKGTTLQVRIPLSQILSGEDREKIGRRSGEDREKIGTEIWMRRLIQSPRLKSSRMKKLKTLGGTLW